MNLKRIELVVVVPVGPTCDIEDVRDTLDSVRCYVTPSHVILLLDDSGKDKGTAITEGFTDVVVLPTAKVHGKDAGLYLAHTSTRTWGSDSSARIESTAAGSQETSRGRASGSPGSWACSRC